MRNLPLAIVAGDVAAMLRAIDRGNAFDIYPDEELAYLDRASSASIGADEVQEELPASMAAASGWR